MYPLNFPSVYFYFALWMLRVDGRYYEPYYLGFLTEHVYQLKKKPLNLKRSDNGIYDFYISYLHWEEVTV